jgi:hypothetical protein
MKTLATYIFYCLWTDISYADYKKSKRFVGPIRTEFERAMQLMDAYDAKRQRAREKFDQDVTDLHIRIDDYREKAGLPSTKTRRAR